MKLGEAACHIIYPGHGNIEGTHHGPQEGAHVFRAQPGSCPIIPAKHTPVAKGGCHSHFNVTQKGLAAFIC